MDSVEVRELAAYRCRASRRLIVDRHERRLDLYCNRRTARLSLIPKFQMRLPTRFYLVIKRCCDRTKVKRADLIIKLTRYPKLRFPDLVDRMGHACNILYRKVSVDLIAG